MNRVVADRNAADNCQVSLLDFRNAFEHKGTEFKTSVDSTRGVFYVRDGKLCSANRHGGWSTVSSGVTNSALRNALITAFEDAGATTAFLDKVRASLLGQHENDDLRRSDVKGFIVQFDQEMKRLAEFDSLEGQKSVSRKAFGSMIGVAPKLEIGDFRKLAAGSGFVGEALETTVCAEDAKVGSDWVAFEHDTKNDDYNAALRQRLFEVVRDAEIPEKLPDDLKMAHKKLLRDLEEPLLGSNRTKPLSCKAIRLALAALDKILASVPPKALGDRTISLKARGSEGDVSKSASLKLSGPGNGAVDVSGLARTNAAKFLKDNAAEIGPLFDKIGSLSQKGLSSESRTILMQILQRSVESLYAEKGVVTMDDLKATGSTFDTIRKLSEEKLFSMCPATQALSLPAKEANAFLRACLLLVPKHDTYGMTNRLHAVASQLALIPPDQFTPENIMRLARPDLPFPPSLRGKKHLQDSKDQDLLFAPLQKLIEESQAYINNHGVENSNSAVLAVQRNVPMMIHAGVSFSDIQRVLKDSKSFSLSMFPGEFPFLPTVTGVDTNVDSSIHGVAADVLRGKFQITILDADGKAKNPCPPACYKRGAVDVFQELASNGKTHLENLKADIATLCGKENVVQQQFVNFFMTQVTEVCENAMNACLGGSQKSPANTQFLLKADPKTGDVYVSKTTDPILDYGLSVTVRIGRDGSMSVVDLQERKTPGVLVPKDGKGLPMDSSELSPSWMVGRSEAAAKAAKDGLGALLAKFGFPADADRDRRMSEYGETFAKEVSRIYCAIANGALTLTEALDQAREAYTAFFDSVLPQDDYAKATKNPSKGRDVGKVVELELRHLKVALPADIFRAALRISDAFRARTEDVHGPIPQQTDPRKESLRQAVYAHVDRLLSDRANPDDPGLARFCAEIGTLDRERIANRLFKEFSEDQLTLDLLAMPLHQLAYKEGGISQNEGFRAELNAELELNHKPNQRPTTINKNFVRELDALQGSHTVILEADGVQEDLADPLGENQKPLTQKTDPRLETQTSGFPKGYLGATHLLKFFDDHVREKMPKGDGASAFNEVLLLVSSAINCVSGPSGYVGNSFDFGYGCRDDANSALGTYKETFAGVADYRSRKIVIRVQKDKEGKPQLVLTQKQPYGLAMNGTLGPNGESRNIGEKLFIPRADLTVVMTIPLDQKAPKPGDPPEYDIDVKFDLRNQP